MVHVSGQSVSGQSVLVPGNDIIISEKRHVLAPKRDCERTRCAMPRRKKVSWLPLAHLKHFKLKY